MIILLLACTCNISRDLQKNIFVLQARSSESAILPWKYNPHTSSKLNFNQGINWANPRALIVIIQGATDYSSLENQSGTKYKGMYIVLVWMLFILTKN
jgi:hypothetical protein